MDGRWLYIASGQYVGSAVHSKFMVVSVMLLLMMVEMGDTD